VGKNTGNCIQYFLALVLFNFCTCCILRRLVCVVVSCLVCIVVVVLCVLSSSYVYLLYCVRIAVFTLDAGMLARSQYSEGPATGHLDTGFSRFPSVYKQMLRQFPTFQVATTCFSSDATQLARSQYSEGRATGHLDTGFSRFPSVYKQMLRRFSTFQVATTCFSRSPPDLNSVLTSFIFCMHVK
jgi:hypothetical protein